MVAASKLRRAQTAAEAARPYAEKMDAVISNIATAAAGSPGAPALLAGTGNDQVHLLLVCTGERGLSGAFNSSIVRLARERALSLLSQGKEVKIFCVGRKGYEQLRRTFEKNIVEHRRPALGSPARLRQCRRHCQKGSGALRGRRVRRLHAVLFALQIRDLADPDRPADHSAGGGSAGRQCRPGDVLRIRAGRGRDPDAPACRAISRCRSSVRSWKTTPRSTARR